MCDQLRNSLTNKIRLCLTQLNQKSSPLLQVIAIRNYNESHTVVRTDKGQITFLRKIKWGLIRDNYLEKFSTKQNIADFLFRLAIFGEKLSLLIFWCEGLGSFLKHSFSGHEKPGQFEIMREIFLLSSWYRRQFLSKLIYLLY